MNYLVVTAHSFPDNESYNLADYESLVAIAEENRAIRAEENPEQR